MKRTKYLTGLAVAGVGAAAWAAVAFGATASHQSGVTVRALDKGISFAPNKYIQDNMGFAPGTVTVASGSSLTFTYGGKPSQEPHTLTIVKRSDLPRTGGQVENCKACQQYATPHLKNPKAPPGEGNPIVHWTLDKGQPGIDTVGDSIAIQAPGPHKSITVKVTAPSGTTLYLLCAVHPWMQGKIVVK